MSAELAAVERFVLVRPAPTGRIFLDARKVVRGLERSELVVSFDAGEVEYARERAGQIAAFFGLPLNDLTGDVQ